MRAVSGRSALALAFLVLVVQACGIETSGPTEVEFQVTEELEFNPELGIDLSAMQKISDGFYIQDLVVGEGDPIGSGDQPRVRYELWLYDGTRIDAGEFDFIVGSGMVIQGFDEGVTGMRVGGKRKIIIPPALGYGGSPNGAIPGGSVLVFEVEVLSVI